MPAADAKENDPSAAPAPAPAPARVNIIVGKAGKPPNPPPSVPASIFAIPNSGMVQCCVVREIPSGNNNPAVPYSKRNPRYTLTFQTGSVIGSSSSAQQHKRALPAAAALIAQRQGGNLTSNYHLFDASRAGPDAKLTKKAGHYAGKLRKDRNNVGGGGGGSGSGGGSSLSKKAASYSLYDSKEEREKVAAFVYDVPSLLSQLKEGQPPRKLMAYVPRDNGDGGGVGGNRLPADFLASDWAPPGGEADEEVEGPPPRPFRVLRTKEPSYESGQYRLNFSGRVSIPSIKNFQLLLDDDDGGDDDGDNDGDDGRVIVQFGRVGEDRFHLDYRAPFNAFQAFALALTQFDL